MNKNRLLLFSKKERSGGRHILSNVTVVSLNETCLISPLTLHSGPLECLKVQSHGLLALQVAALNTIMLRPKPLSVFHTI
ncbi:hypothetical protein BDQ17DRAFT_1378007, partial [Cyathus striatus]